MPFLPHQVLKQSSMDTGATPQISQLGKRDEGDPYQTLLDIAGLTRSE